MCEITLSCLRPGDSCVLRSVGLYGAMRRRLRDLGMLPGTVISCTNMAPSGSPMAFRIKGAVVALRLEDCRRIRVTPCG